MPLAGAFITLFMRVGKTAEREQKQDYNEQQRIPGNVRLMMIKGT